MRVENSNYLLFFQREKEEREGGGGGQHSCRIFDLDFDRVFHLFFLETGGRVKSWIRFSAGYIFSLGQGLRVH